MIDCRSWWPSRSSWFCASSAFISVHLRLRKPGLWCPPRASAYPAVTNPHGQRVAHPTRCRSWWPSRSSWFCASSAFISVHLRLRKPGLWCPPRASAYSAVTNPHGQRVAHPTRYVHPRSSVVPSFVKRRSCLSTVWDIHSLSGSALTRDASNGNRRIKMRSATRAFGGIMSDPAAQ